LSGAILLVACCKHARAYEVGTFMSLARRCLHRAQGEMVQLPVGYTKIKTPPRVEFLFWYSPVRFYDQRFCLGKIS